ncbi:MAG TPA: Ig-like domain-containing protein, partial [Gemmatimonadales bacterium]|nr:Ig-like domain-containing protein [Gemmatimonadales bacterium]
MRHSSCWFHELAFLALTGCAASPEGTTTLQPSNLLAGGGTASVCLPTNSGDLFIEGIQNPTIYHQVVGIQFNAVNYVYSTCGGIYSVTPGGYSVFNNWTVGDSRIATPGTKTTAAGQGWAFTGVSSGFTSLRVDCVSGDPSYGTCGTKVVLLDIGSPSSVSVSGPASIYVGEDYNFVATATDQYGTTVTRTGTAVWSSSNPSAANLISTARVHAYAQGTTTLTANLYGVA